MARRSRDRGWLRILLPSAFEGICIGPVCFFASCKFLLRWGVFFAILDDVISNKQPEVVRLSAYCRIIFRRISYDFSEEKERH